MTPSIDNTLVVHRLQVFKEHGTFGYLEFLKDGSYFKCDTLEPSNLDGKRNHAILPGVYPLFMTYSPKFHMVMPLLRVPDRIGIRIHPGNRYPGDTRGCIVVGERSRFILVNSRRTMNTLLELLRKNDIRFVDVRDERTPDSQFNFFSDL